MGNNVDVMDPARAEMMNKLGEFFKGRDKSLPQGFAAFLVLQNDTFDIENEFKILKPALAELFDNKKIGLPSDEYNNGVFHPRDLRSLLDFVLYLKSRYSAECDDGFWNAFFERLWISASHSYDKGVHDRPENIEARLAILEALNKIVPHPEIDSLRASLRGRIHHALDISVKIAYQTHGPERDLLLANIADAGDRFDYKPPTEIGYWQSEAAKCIEGLANEIKVLEGLVGSEKYRVKYGLLMGKMTSAHYMAISQIAERVGSAEITANGRTDNIDNFIAELKDRLDAADPTKPANSATINV